MLEYFEWTFEYPGQNILTFVGLLLGALVGSGVGLGVCGLGVGGRGVGRGLGGGFVGTGIGFVGQLQLGAVFVSTSNISKEFGGGGLLGTGYVGLGGRGVG